MTTKRKPRTRESLQRSVVEAAMAYYGCTVANRGHYTAATGRAWQRLYKACGNLASNERRT